MASARIHEAIAKEINEEYGMDETLLRIGIVDTKYEVQETRFISSFLVI